MIYFKTAVYDPPCGGDIKQIIKEAISICQVGTNHCVYEQVEVDLNQVHVVVKADSKLDLIFRDCQRSWKGVISGTVGPYPDPLLPDDKAKEIELARGRFEAHASYAANKDNKYFSLYRELKWCEPFKCKDYIAREKYRQDNQGHWWAETFEFAENWARLMQRGHSNAMELANINYMQPDNIREAKKYLKAVWEGDLDA